MRLQPPETGKRLNHALARMMEMLEQSQWYSPEEVMVRQLGLLRHLLIHHERHTPWVRKRIAHSGHAVDALSSSLAAWSSFPLTSRRDLQEADLFSQFVPQVHQPVVDKKSSGSTGEPVTVRRTAVSQLFWQATTLREHLWHQRKAKGTLVAIRAHLTQAMASKGWGSPVGDFFETGSSYGIPSNTDVTRLLAWLKDIRPDYLLIYPSIWRAVLDAAGKEPGLWDKLHQVRTLGETLTDELRIRTRAETAADIVDLYSAEELGTIALQCPHSGLYHVMAEGLIVEIINTQGTACQPGEIGRVVVTDLMNLATPLLRYENGDIAEAGPTCSCGRGLPTLQRIRGRVRNMVHLPDGRSYWPTTGFREFSSIADVRQYQFIQKSLTEMEVRLVVTHRHLSPEQEAGLRQLITCWIGHPFEYRFRYFDNQIPKHTTGKFEEFICELT
jgi:phenylacetate-CoA ligase